ncbi:MAG: hypothetical protein WDZ38_08075 [Balneolaceae bacterium]
MAASRPFLPPEFGWSAGNEPKVIGILIDSSPAMERISSDGPYIEQAKKVAETLIDMTGNDDRITVDGTHGESMSVPLLTGRSVLSNIENMNVTNGGNYTSNRLESLIRRLRDAAEPNKILYFITDGRRSLQPQLEKLKDSVIEDIHLQIILVNGADAVNLGFEDVSLESGVMESSGNLQLRSILQNYGERELSNVFISLIIDDELASQQTFNIQSGSSREFLFEIPVTENEMIKMELLVEGDDLTFDNRYRAVIQLPENRSILVVYEENAADRNFSSYLRPMLEIAGDVGGRFQVDFTDIRNFEVSNLFDYDAVVLDGLRSIPDFLGQSLLDHVQNGAGLLIIPSADGSINSYNRLLESSGSARYSNIVGSYGSFRTIDRMANPTEGHPILENIFEVKDEEEVRLNVPEIFYYYQIEPTGKIGNFSVLNTRTGYPLLMESRVGNGRLIVSAIGSDPGWSNFPVKPLFAPLFYRTVDYLARGEHATLNNHELGSPFVYLISGNPESLEINKEGETILPESRQTYYGTEITYPGIEWSPGWLIIESEEKEKEIEIGLNHSTMESQLHTFDIPELESFVSEWFPHNHIISLTTENEQMSDQLELASFGKEIWYWFVLIAIILLLLESIISRHYKAETLG